MDCSEAQFTHVNWNIHRPTTVPLQNLLEPITVNTALDIDVGIESTEEIDTVVLLSTGVENSGQQILQQGPEIITVDLSSPQTPQPAVTNDPIQSGASKSVKTPPCVKKLVFSPYIKTAMFKQKVKKSKTIRGRKINFTPYLYRPSLNKCRIRLVSGCELLTPE